MKNNEITLFSCINCFNGNNIKVIVKGRWIKITVSLCVAISCAAAAWHLLPS